MNYLYHVERRSEVQLEAGQKSLATAEIYLKVLKCTLSWKKCGKILPLNISPDIHVLLSSPHENELTKTPLCLILIQINIFCFCLQTIFVLKRVAYVLLLSFPIVEIFRAWTRCWDAWAFLLPSQRHVPSLYLCPEEWFEGSDAFRAWPGVWSCTGSPG